MLAPATSLLKQPNLLRSKCLSDRQNIIDPLSSLLSFHVPTVAHLGLHPGLYEQPIAAVLVLTLPALPQRKNQISPEVPFHDLCDTWPQVIDLADRLMREPGFSPELPVIPLSSTSAPLVFLRGKDMLVGVNPTQRPASIFFAMQGYVASELLDGSNCGLSLQPGATHMAFPSRSWAVYRLFPRL